VTIPPYRGLEPYDEAEADFFFGRDDERTLIVANLRSARLTLLYGPSGVGKSSLLRAGVAHHLRAAARESTLRRGSPRGGVVVFSTWSDAPLERLTARIERDAGKSLPQGASKPDRQESLTATLRAWSEALGGPVCVLLDQFEEYFLYHDHAGAGDEFATQLADAITETGAAASFLVALREEELAGLDRFEELIDNLFANLLRVEHLDREKATLAIVEPVKKYDAVRTGDEPSVTIADDLVEKVLDDLAEGLPFAVETAVTTATPNRFEAPYLQLVMERLWRTAIAAEPHELSLSTLVGLGGSRAIVRTHLDETMARLSAGEQDVAADVLRYLVTPSGRKIAQTAADLASYAGIAPEDADVVDSVLKGLSGRTRILRSVPPPPGSEGPQRYEIFHDILAIPILDWRARHAFADELDSAERTRLRRIREAYVAGDLQDADGFMRADGVHVYGLLGALLGFAEHPTKPITKWRCVAGAGTGAIVAALLTCGYDAKDVAALLDPVTMRSFADYPMGSKLLGQLRLVLRHGMAPGTALHRWLDGVLEGRTFDVLTAPGTGSRLRLVAGDLTRQRLLILPDDLTRYRVPGAAAPIDPNRFPVSTAVRMSSSMPLVFSPVELELVLDDDGEEIPPRRCSIVDGSLFPALDWIWDTPSQPTRPTFALTTVNPERETVAPGQQLLPWVFRLGADLSRLGSVHDVRLESQSSLTRRCAVRTGRVEPGTFDPSTEAADELIENGRRAATAFLDRFSFERYANSLGGTLVA
jgi:predicted acylesterase/phospholipase RssA